MDSSDYRAIKDGVVDLIAIDFSGAIAEFAWAIVSLESAWEGAILTPSEILRWKSEGRMDFPDLEVKSTEWATGHLPLQGELRNKINQNAPHVLAIVSPKHDRVKFVGWCFGLEFRVPESADPNRHAASPFWNSKIDRPCYMIPQLELRPIQDLFELRKVQPIRPFRTEVQVEC